MARRKSSLVNRGINLGLLLLAFMPAITRAFAGNFNDITRLYTADLINGKFNKAFALEAYGPVAAAFVLFEVKKMAMKKFRF